MLKQFSTSVLVFNNPDLHAEILLLFHKKFAKWMVPGGHVEPGENPLECAIREVKEETGIAIRPISFIHRELSGEDSTWVLPPEYMFEQIIPAFGNKDRHIHIDCVYVAIALTTEIEVNYQETEAVRWTRLDKLDELDLFDGTRKIIHEIQKKFESECSFGKRVIASPY